MTHKMAVVIGATLIITQEAHRVTLHNMFGVLIHKPLYHVPERGDRLHIFVQTDHKTVFLPVFGHECERIVMKVAIKVNTWFDSPIPLVIQQQRLTEEESGFKSAHKSICDRVPVNDFLFCHFLADLARFILVNPFRDGPVFLRNSSILRLSRYQGRGNFLKGLIKWLIIQEDPIIAIVPIKSVLDLADSIGNFPYITVTRECHECSILSRPTRLRLR